MIRVLVAEDSATSRALLVDILQSDPEIRVVAEARDGREAVALTQEHRPDLVTMDIEMPGLDGLEATREIMITAPTPIVIISGSTRAAEVSASLNTLRLGALEVLAKPPGPGSPEFDPAARRLLATVRAMADVKVVRHWRPIPATPPRRARPVPAPRPRGAEGRVIAVATSTGGPAALRYILSELPEAFRAPILVVQHLSPGFTEGLVSWLDSVCTLRVVVAEQGRPLEAGAVYIAPDDRHLGVSKGRQITLSEAAPIGGFRPSGTWLFESVARSLGTSAVALILTGMGDDGVAGLAAVRRAGGRVLAQDEDTSVVYGMPGAAAATGLVEASLSLEAIASHLATLA